MARTGRLNLRLPEEQNKEFRRIDRKRIDLLEAILNEGIAGGSLRPLNFTFTHVR